MISDSKKSVQIQSQSSIQVQEEQSKNIKTLRSGKIDEIFKNKTQDEKLFIFSKDYITLDSFGFGMGNCCIQITYSFRNLFEARKAYDSFSVLSGLLAAFSASTAVVDSALIDWDLRSRMIEQSADCRKPQEYVLYLFLISFAFIN